MPGDLHNHTTYSDGSVPVARLPLMAARVGLDAMAISDHDTLRSVQYAYDHPVQDGVKLIPATELTGYDYERQHRVHLLAYWPDPESEALRRHCDIMRQRRNECCLQSARELEAIFPQFRTEQALEYARDSGVLYKSGIMQALRELGLADSIYGERYHELFGWNPRGRVPLARVHPGAGGAGHSQSRRCRGGVRPPHRVQEYAPAPGTGQGGDGGRHRDRPPQQQPRGQGRVCRSLWAVSPHPHRRHRLPRGQPQKGLPRGHLHHPR